jgi:hypothetical protein
MKYKVIAPDDPRLGEPLDVPPDNMVRMTNVNLAMRTLDVIEFKNGEYRLYQGLKFTIVNPSNDDGKMTWALAEDLEDEMETV